MTGIYMLYWNDTNHYYIGKANHITKRYEQHKYMLLANRHHNKEMQSVYNQYGYPNVKVLEYVTYGEMKYKEVAYIWLNYSAEYCLNKVDAPPADKPMIITLNKDLFGHISRIRGVSAMQYIQQLIQSDYNNREA